MSGWRLGVACGTAVLAVLLLHVLVGRAVSLALPLTELPFDIGSWTGRSETIPPAMWQRARPDQAVSRRYMDGSGRAVTVYVGYYTHEASRGQALAVCPGDCEVLDTGVQAIGVDGGHVLVSRARVQQNGIYAVILYWYHSGHGVVTDASSQRRFDQFLRAVRSRRSDGAVVRVSAAISSTEQEAIERGVAFVQTFMPVLRRHLPE
jgi:EpsI family protein